MQLKTFNVATTPPRIRQQKEAVLSLVFRSGLFSFNKAATEVLGLVAGDLIVLHQDEDIPENWYLEKVKSDGFALRSKADTTFPMMMNNAALLHEMISSVEFPEKAVGCKLIITDEAHVIDRRKLYLVQMTEAEVREKAEAPE